VFNLETVDIQLPAEVATLFDPFVAALSARVETMRGGLRLDIASLARLCVHASSLRGSQAIAEFATRTFGRLLNLESAQLVLRSNNGPGEIASHWRRPDSQLAALNPAAVELLIQTENHDAAVTAFGVASAATLGHDSDSRAPWVVWFPLRVAGHELGTLVGRAATRDIDRERTEAVSLIAQHAAALIDIAQRLRREERAATTDALTGLLNRRGFEERHTQELARAERHNETLSLLSIDCDGLKRINDHDGHHIGDQALRQTATTIRAHRRVSDPAARLGGDEFVIILPATTATEATAIAERIRTDIATELVGNGHRLTTSIGLATFPHHATTPDTLLLAADSALYQAKRNGGNRLIHAT
jgi:diguanylate cyclase (GGDEF)-like protein